MSKQIQLTQGQVTTVCDCCYHEVCDQSWYAAYDHRSGNYYAQRVSTSVQRAAGMADVIMLHAVINGTPVGFYTDHKDGNTLNNQCNNLRTATPSQNKCNSKKRSDNTSGYKGVSFEKESGKWRAKMTLNGKQNNLGRFSNIIDAALAYDAAARKYHGKFAQLNFPDE